jgi:cytochrome P450
MRRDPLGFWSSLNRRYGDIVPIRVWPWVSYMIYHPDQIKHVLQDNNHNYVKGIVIEKIKVLIGEGLFSSEGDFWRRQRRLAQPAFHRQRITGFADTMTACATAMLERWDATARNGAALDVAAEMNRLTLEIAGKTLFSMDLSGEAGAFGRALLDALEYLNHRATSFFPLPVAVPTPRNWRYRGVLRHLDGVVYKIIATRRQTGEDPGDLLSMLLQARDEETGESMTDRQLRDEVMTFLLAGHETTAVTLSWTWYLLDRHPEVDARLRAELRAVLNGRTPTVTDLPALPYTRMVIEETLRLYPPVAGIVRQAVGADRIGPYSIRPGTVVSMSPYVTHRHPAFWDDPERFDPERFRAERAASRPRFAYFPFSGGPRLCIGNEFALMEGQLLLATIAQRYRLRAVPGHAVEPEVRLTLRPRGGLPMTLAPAAIGSAHAA